MKRRVAVLLVFTLILVAFAAGVVLADPSNNAVTIYDITCTDGSTFDEAVIPGSLVTNGRGSLAGLVVGDTGVGTAHSLYFCAADACSGAGDAGWVNIWVRGQPNNMTWCEWTGIDGYSGDCDDFLPDAVCFGGDILLSPGQ